MKYVCLVYGEEKDLYAMTPERMAKLDADSLAYDRSVAQSGRLIIAQALQSVQTSNLQRAGVIKVSRQLAANGAGGPSFSWLHATFAC
ncbi:MAG: hypothetical protein E5W69_02255 [Mesorhizobium sp.]|nr:MAG: hypothetical protein E5W69_02255 [Mesorhizobium sp.]